MATSAPVSTLGPIRQTYATADSFPPVARAYTQVSRNSITVPSFFENRLRDSSRLTGRCGSCEFGRVCGGSRSRAYAAGGDVHGEDPLCGYEPGSFPFPDDISQLLSA